LKKPKTKDILLLCVPFLAAALILTVIQPPISFSWLAWVSLVPFVLACSPSAKPKGLALAAYFVSLAYWLANLYWVFPVTIVGWAAYCLYQGLLWPIIALSLRYCRIKKIPVFLAVPVLFVGAERLQGLFLGGFFWRFLAHSQYANITLIQISDIFGAAGVSFLVALVNGLLAEWIIAARLSSPRSARLNSPRPGKQRRLLTARNVSKSVFVTLALTASILYGRWRIGQTETAVEAGPLVGSLQSNTPQSVKRTFDDSNDIFNQLRPLSTAAANAGATLVVWPETMVQATLNTDIWAILDAAGQTDAFARDKVFDRELRQLAQQDGAYLLIGAYGERLRRQPDETPYLARFNSAFLYTPDGRQAPQQYDKIHLVPFGEVVPFRRRLPSLYNLLMRFTPYKYDYSLDYGTEFTVFEMTLDPTSSPAAPQKQTCRFSVMICYEDTIPKIARKFTLDARGQKRIDWLVNISNDGWFVRFKDPKVLPSTELPQHAAVCVFRAVENRIAVVRSVNTGISCIIDTTGRIRNAFVAGNLPKKALERKAVAGWFVDNLPIDNRVTFFTRYGQWLDFCCALCLLVLIIVASFAGSTRDTRRSARSSR
jgi:apolipoprotein N-acyltransferase